MHQFLYIVRLEVNLVTTVLMGIRRNLYGLSSMFLLIKLNVGGYLAKNNDVTENTPLTQDNTEDMDTRTLD